MKYGKVVQFPTACKSTRKRITKRVFYIALYDFLKTLNTINDKESFYTFVFDHENEIDEILHRLIHRN